MNALQGWKHRQVTDGLCHLRGIRLAIVLLVAAALLQSRFVPAASPQAGENWPHWRGPLQTGVAPAGNPPVQWSEEQNVKWKVKIPGKGHSTPIVWGDKVFLLTAINTGKKPEEPAEDTAENAEKTEPAAEAQASAPAATNNPPSDAGSSPQRGSADREDRGNRGEGEEGDRDRGRGSRGGFGRGGPGAPGGFGRGGPGRPGAGRGFRMRTQKPTEIYQFVVLCLDRKTGKTLWEKTVREELPHEGHRADHGFASYSPVTDGTWLIAHFGSRGLHGLDLDGNVKWEKDLGKMRIANSFGEGGSPALYGNTVVVKWDHEGDDFIAAFDKATGDELWRTPRDERTSWSTPLIVEVDGKPQVITTATNRVRGYDLATGAELWESPGLTANAIPSPVAANGVLYATAGFRGSALFAIRLGGAGNLEDTDAILWSHDKDTPYVPSPLLVGKRLYFVKSNNNLLSCLDVETGDVLFGPERLQDIQMIYASPVAANGRVYVVGRNGTTLVVKDQDSDELEVLATNKLDEGIDASPAIVGNELFLRGKEHLYCIAEE